MQILVPIHFLKFVKILKIHEVFMNFPEEVSQKVGPDIHSGPAMIVLFWYEIIMKFSQSKAHFQL